MVQLHQKGHQKQRCYPQNSLSILKVILLLLYYCLFCTAFSTTLNKNEMISFRKAKISDMGKIASLCTETLQDYDNKKEVSSSTSSSTYRLQLELESRMVSLVNKGAKHIMLVAIDGSNKKEEEEIICGFTEMGMMPLPIRGQDDELKLNMNLNEEYPYIANVAIRNDFRRRGIGSKMIKIAYKIATQKWDHNAMFLSVEKDNYNAIQMYENKLNFDILIDETATTQTQKAANEAKGDGDGEDTKSNSKSPQLSSSPLNFLASLVGGTNNSKEKQQQQQRQRRRPPRKYYILREEEGEEEKNDD